MKPVLLCSHSSQCFNKIISRNTLGKLRIDYHRIKVRKQSSKCSHSSQCFNKIISRNTLDKLRMDYHRIKVRKQSSKCSHSAQCFLKITCRTTQGELRGGANFLLIREIILLKPILLCSHSSQCFNKIISRNTLDKLRMDYHRIKVRKQSSKCSLHSQCFRTLIRYIVSIWIPALYLLLSGVIPLRMISWQIIFRKLKSVCLLRAQRFRNIICHNSLGEVTDGLSSFRYGFRLYIPFRRP